MFPGSERYMSRVISKDNDVVLTRGETPFTYTDVLTDTFCFKIEVKSLLPWCHYNCLYHLLLVES